MKKMDFVKSTMLAAGLVLLAAGCVVREEVRYRTPPTTVVAQPGIPGTEVVVTDAPPTPIVETVTVAPSPGFIWIGGAWVWHAGWVWEPGHWAHPPRPGAVWVPHRYAYRGGRHMIVRGYWR